MTCFQNSRPNLQSNFLHTGERMSVKKLHKSANFSSNNADRFWYNIPELGFKFWMRHEVPLSKEGNETELQADYLIKVFNHVTLKMDLNSLKYIRLP